MAKWQTRLVQVADSLVRRGLEAVTLWGDTPRPVKEPAAGWTQQGTVSSVSALGWSVPAVRGSLASHAAGSFGGTGVLADDFFLHPIIAKCIKERCNFPAELPRMLTPADTSPEAGYIADWMREYRDEIYPDSIIRTLIQDELQMGQTAALIDWEERKDGRHRWWLPVIKPWHPSLLQYSFRNIGRSIDGGAYLANSMNRGMLLVEPGMGRWFLSKQAERQAWLWGAVYSLGMDFIGDLQNFLDNLAFEERFGLGVFAYSHDENYSRRQVGASTASIGMMGSGAVVPLRMRNGTALEKLELLSTSGSGFQAFGETESRILRRILLYYLGQDMTSHGSAGGYKQAVVHQAVRWNKQEETASWFFDAERVVGKDPSTGRDKVSWQAKDGDLRRQITKWITWYNFRSFDLAPRYWFDATPPDQQAERESLEAKRTLQYSDALAKLLTAGKDGAPAVLTTLETQTGIKPLALLETLGFHFTRRGGAADMAAAAIGR